MTEMKLHTILINLSSGAFEYTFYENITFENLSRADFMFSTRIVLHPYQWLLDQVLTAKGYYMHTNRYYTSVFLAEELRKIKCHLIGTIRTNRKGVPRALKKLKFYKKKDCRIHKGKYNVISLEG